MGCSLASGKGAGQYGRLASSGLGAGGWESRTEWGEVRENTAFPGLGGRSASTVVPGTTELALELAGRRLLPVPPRRHPARHQGAACARQRVVRARRTNGRAARAACRARLVGNAKGRGLTGPRTLCARIGAGAAQDLLVDPNGGEEPTARPGPSSAMLRRPAAESPCI